MSGLTFNKEGKVTKFTIGYVRLVLAVQTVTKLRMDRMVGNTGGMGGFFGVLWRIGKGFPFPEGQPYTPSTSYWLFTQARSCVWSLNVFKCL